jgi:hypothetical protein
MIFYALLTIIEALNEAWQRTKMHGTLGKQLQDIPLRKEIESKRAHAPIDGAYNSNCLYLCLHTSVAYHIP